MRTAERALHRTCAQCTESGQDGLEEGARGPKCTRAPEEARTHPVASRETPVILQPPIAHLRAFPTTFPATSALTPTTFAPTRLPSSAPSCVPSKDRAHPYSAHQPPLLPTPRESERERERERATLTFWPANRAAFFPRVRHVPGWKEKKARSDSTYPPNANIFFTPSTYGRVAGLALVGAPRKKSANG